MDREDDRSDQRRSRPGSLERYQQLFERSADAILIIEGDSFVDCNEATVRMLGYRGRAELLQTHPSQLSPEFQPDGRRSFEKANEIMAEAFEQGSRRFEWTHRRANGELFPVEVLLTAVSEGERQLLHVVWRDITERKRLENELRHAQKMEAIGKLAGGIAHDFNNILVALIGYADLVALKLEDGSEAKRYVGEIQRAAERAAALTSQLLAFSRKQDLAPEVIDLNVNLRSLDTMLQRLIGEDIQVVLELREEPLFLKVDPGQVEQVVLNIAANSRDAMPEGGTLTLRTDQVDAGAIGGAELLPGEYVSLQITDTGVGMAPEVASRAFDPFFTTKDRGRGTGLGLASVYGIVKQSGGEVRIISEVGEGTSVEVFLPLTSERAPVEEPRPRKPAASSAPRERFEETVLLVEDDRAVAGLVRNVLLREGYRVLEAQNGAEALQLVGNTGLRLDLLLTDVVMPVMSGPELVARLAEKRPELPVLFVSGYTDDALAEHGFRIGEVELLRKPFSPRLLTERVRERIDR